MPASRAPAKNTKAIAGRVFMPNRPGFAKVSTDKRQPENECTRFQAAFFADKHLNALNLNAPANQFRWMGEQRLGFIEATGFQAASSHRRQQHQPLTNQYASIRRSAIQPSFGNAPPPLHTPPIAPTFSGCRTDCPKPQRQPEKRMHTFFRLPLHHPTQ